MKNIAYLAIWLLLAGLSNASAENNRFTATSTSYGVLGYMDFDSSVFDGSSVQFVTNDDMLSLDFTNPLNSFHLTTIGPVSPLDGTYFDSSGAGLPTVLGGFGAQGGTGPADTVSIGSSSWGVPNFLVLGNGMGNNLFSDVSWSASLVSAIPEPETYAMLLTGLGLMGFVARRRRNNLQATA